MSTTQLRATSLLPHPWVEYDGKIVDQTTLNSPVCLYHPSYTIMECTRCMYPDIKQWQRSTAYKRHLSNQQHVDLLRGIECKTKKADALINTLIVDATHLHRDLVSIINTYVEPIKFFPIIVESKKIYSDSVHEFCMRRSPPMGKTW